MIKRRAKLDRLRKTAYKPFISAFLAAVLGLGSASSLLHIAFSSHHHHYCSLHGQVEEVLQEETDSGNISNNSLDRADRDDPAVCSASDLAPRHHVACAVLNGGTPRFRPATKDCLLTIIGLDNGKRVYNASKPMASRCRRLLFAPKNSPPEDVRAIV